MGPPRSSTIVVNPYRLALYTFTLLLLGLVTSILLAFVGATLLATTRTVTESQGNYHRRETTVGFTAFECFRPWSSQTTHVAARAVFEECLQMTCDSGPSAFGLLDNGPRDYFIIGTSGFPCRCLWGWRHRGSFGGPSMSGGDLRALLSPRGAKIAEPIIPFFPLYRGLILNTLFYAALWLGLFTLAHSARRAIRNRRGLCPKCAYDLRATPAGSPCPECGTQRALAPTRT